MARQNKSPKSKAYRLITVCLFGLAVGCVIPILNALGRTDLSRGYLIAMEFLGTAALCYVFGIYIFKK